LIQNDSKIYSRHASLDIKSEETSCQDVESLVYLHEEKKDQSKFCIGMHIFDHYNNEDNLMEYNMHVDPLFLQVQSNFTTGVSLPKSFHLSSRLACYSLYPNMCDKFIIPLLYGNPLYTYLVGHGHYQVQDDVVLR